MTNVRPTTIVAAVQATPVFLDRDATIDKVGDAHQGGGRPRAPRLVAFPEGFVPTYPDWVWRTTPWADGEWYARWIDQCVDVPGPACDALGDIARENEVYLAVPVNERDGGTVYNTILYFGPDGALLGKHRKLVATGGERLAWGMGDGSTLPVFDTPFGRLGGLICWENYMPLARAAMYEQGVDILLAPTWDNSDVWVASMRHIAKEGRCYVLGITSCLRGSDVPADIPGPRRDLRRRRRLDVTRQHRDRRSVRRHPRGPDQRDRRHPLRRGRRRDGAPVTPPVRRRRPLRAPRRVQALRAPRLDLAERERRVHVGEQQEVRLRRAATSATR